MVDRVNVAFILVVVTCGCVFKVHSSMNCLSYCMDEVRRSFDCPLKLVDVFANFDTEITKDECGPSSPTLTNCTAYNDGNTSVLIAVWKAPDDSSIDDLTGFRVDVKIPNALSDTYNIKFATNKSRNMNIFKQYQYRIECEYSEKAYLTFMDIVVYSLPRNGFRDCSDQRVKCHWDITNIVLPTPPKSSTTMAPSSVTVNYITNKQSKQLAAISQTPPKSNTTTVLSSVTVNYITDKQSKQLAAIIVPVVMVVLVLAVVSVFCIRKGSRTLLVCHSKDTKDDDTTAVTNVPTDLVDKDSKHINGVQNDNRYVNGVQNGFLHYCPVHGHHSVQASPSVNNLEQFTPPLQNVSSYVQFTPETSPTTLNARRCLVHTYRPADVQRVPYFYRQNSNEESQEDNESESIESRMLQINDMCQSNL